MFQEFSALRQVRNFRRVFLPLSGAFFVYTFGWGVTSPIFSIYVDRVTGSAFLTGVILSITTMAGVVLNIPFGILEDRLNMKRILQAVLLTYAVLALLYPEATSLGSLLMLSVARGIASSFLWLTSWAYVLSYADASVKGKEVGFFSDMNDLASALSPVVGGVVALLSFVLPFYVLSGTSLAALAVVTLFLKEAPPPSAASFRTQAETLGRHMRDRRFLRTVYLIVVFYALINVYYSFLALFLNGEGISVTVIGLLLTVALIPAVALEVPMGNLIDRHGIRKTLSAAIALTAVTALLLPEFSDPVAVGVIVTAFTVSYTMIFIGLYSRMSDILREDKVAMTGAIATFKDLGYTLGPLLAGFLMISMSMQTVFLVVGAGFVLLLPVAVRLRD
jgi:MFS family permease